ncbi:MAG: DUF3379 family protein [Opitutaceae bacterium]
MNREEAQFILGAYRANSEDARDPQFQEALALARHDPELGRWFAEQQALDRAFSAKLRSLPLPADLKAQLLLARTTLVSTPRWRRPVWLAVAASVALLFVVSISLLKRRGQASEFVQFRQAMADVASLYTSSHADIWGLNAAGYKRWLVEHRGDPDFVLPPGLADKGISACKIVEWQQSKVTMLCFKFDGRHVDVFVVNASDLPGVSLDRAPAFFADRGVTTAAWHRDGKVYLVAGAMPKSELQQFL